MAEKIKVTVWNECRHEKSDAAAKAMYPNGIHGTIKEFLDKNPDMEVRAVTLDDPDQGLPDLPPGRHRRPPLVGSYVPRRSQGRTR